MKRTSMKNKQLELKRRLALVRTTIRELTPVQLGRVNGGADTDNGCADITTGTCCVLYTTRAPTE